MGVEVKGEKREAREWFKLLDSVERKWKETVVPKQGLLKTSEQDSVGVPRLMFFKERSQGLTGGLKEELGRVLPSTEEKDELFLCARHMMCFTFITLFNLANTKKGLYMTPASCPCKSSTVRAGTSTVRRGSCEHESYRMNLTWKSQWLSAPRANLKFLWSVCKQPRWNNNDILSLFEVSEFLITVFLGHTFICIDPIIQGSTQLKVNQIFCSSFPKGSTLCTKRK